MELAVVIVTHNQYDVLRNCVRSVLEAMEGVDGEVIVVDNASTDATPEMMAKEFSQVRYLRNAVNVHYTRAVNQGMRATGGRCVMLLNDDTVAERESLRKLIKFIDDHPRCGACGPALLSPQGDVQVSAQRFPTPFREVMLATGLAWCFRHKSWARGMQMQYPMPMDEGVVDWVCGGAILFRRPVIEQLGYHDEQYLFYRDDPDIGMRLKSAGWEVRYFPESRFMHYHGMSTVKTPKKVRFGLIAVRSRRHYHRKFHGVLGSLVVEVCHGLCALLRAGKAAATLKLDKARKNWDEVVVLLQALSTPREELEAIAGYRSSLFNGSGAAENAAVAQSSPSACTSSILCNQGDAR